MDKKFYVTFETAKLLKEKGFNKTVDKLIHLNQYNIPIIESPEKYYDESEVYNDYLHLKQNHYACPTKSEVIDWLESKGIIISPHPVTILREDGTTKTYWSCHIVHKDGTWYTTNDLPTRLEAEEAAIIKVLKLL